MSFLSRSAIALLAASVCGGAALAKEAVVSPFLPRSVDRLVALNITSLISSELDFNPEYELVTQLEDLPRGMNVACVNKASCLRPIGRAHNANHLIAGTVAPKGRDQFQLYLVLFDTDRGTFIRKKTFDISKSPDVMADSIANVVNVLLTGREKEAPVDAAAPIADGSFDDFVEEEDDFAFEEEPSSHRMNLPGSSNNTLDDFEEDPLEAEGSRLADERRREEAARQAAEDRRREEAARRAAEDRRRREEEAARRAAQEREREEAARRAAEDRRREREAQARRDEERRERDSRRRQPSTNSIDDVDDFEFGAVGAEEIGVDDFQFGSAASLIEEDPAEDFDEVDRLDDLGLDQPYGDTEYADTSRYETVDNLDDPDPSERSARSNRRDRRSNSRSSRARVSQPFVSKGNSTAVTVRGGISQFQTLTFYTYGAEVAIPMGDRASFTAGVEFQSTYREPGPEVDLEELNLPPAFWNTIMPLHAGGLYRFSTGRLQPYAGADIVLAPYTKDFKVAVGGRAKAGVDFMLTKSIALNGNLSTGIWYGSSFDSIQADLSDVGFVPQGTLGTSFLF